MISEDMQQQKINTLEKVLTSFFMRWNLYIEQITLDFLEECDELIKLSRNYPFEFELNFERMQSKAKSLDIKYLGTHDISLLEAIKEIKYQEL